MWFTLVSLFLRHPGATSPSAEAIFQAHRDQPIIRWYRRHVGISPRAARTVAPSVGSQQPPATC